MYNRRKFIAQSSLLLGGTAVAGVLDNRALAAFRKRVSAGDQLNIAAIGINGMGWSNTSAALKVPGVNLVALCDVDKNVIARRLKELPNMHTDPARVKVYGDYRKLLEQKDIDAVIIGTPDHWHALQMIHACEAGKHVYVEKPIGNSIGECRAMVAAQKRYNRIVQAGQWQRSQQHFKDAIDFVHSGQLGNIRTVKAWCYLDWKQPVKPVADSPVPEGVDYSSWLGPAPARPFNKNRFHFTFRWFWDYAGGLMTDWGVHLLDYALIGMKAETPLSVAALGGKFADPGSADETPDTLMTLYQFEHFNLIWDHAVGIGNGDYNRDHGIAFIGNNGTLVLNRGGWEVIEEKKNANKVSVPVAKSVDNGLEKHWQNFVGAIRSGSGEGLHCPVEAGAHIATVAQMGNIAYRSGKRVNWDKQAGAFADAELNKTYFTKEYHNGYALPKV